MSVACRNATLRCRNGAGSRMTHHMTYPKYARSVVAAMAVFFSACGDDDPSLTSAQAANLVVRQRIEQLAPAANLGHRGTGVNREGHALAENSLASFLQAMSDGADGIELDVELTSDGRLIVMHDDTLERTTTCSGCVSAYTFAAARACRLINFAGEPTSEPPPTLAEVYAVLPATALVNVELKVYDQACATPSTGATELAYKAAAEIKSLGVASRTLFSSFSEEAAVAIKQADPHLYSAQLVSGVLPTTLPRAVERGLDAIHPLFLAPATTVRRILDAGLQVNVWTVVLEENMQQSLDRDVSAIITDEPGLLRQVINQRKENP